MAYQRKTKDVYEIQGSFGNSWEYWDEADTMKEARRMKQEYSICSPQTPARIVKKRERI